MLFIFLLLILPCYLHGNRAHIFKAKKSQNSGSSFEGEKAFLLLTDTQPSAGFTSRIRAHAPAQGLSGGTLDVVWMCPQKLEKSETHLTYTYKPQEYKCVDIK